MRIRLYALTRLLSAVTTISATSAPQEKPNYAATLRPISRSATGDVLVAGTTFTFQWKPAVGTKVTLELILNGDTHASSGTSALTIQSTLSAVPLLQVHPIATTTSGRFHIPLLIQRTTQSLFEMN